MTTIAGFEVLGVLGEGASSVVTKVRDPRSGALYALKLCKDDRPAVRERLLREGRVQSALRHPGIVPVVDVVEHEGRVGLLMEFVEATTLQRVIERNGALRVQDALELLKPVVAAVGFAHAQGVLHRDLKPANLLVTREGHVRVTDFGIARLLDNPDGRRLTREGVALGTPGYMAPEQWADAASVGPAADVYSLGSILGELLIGRPIFEGDDNMVLMQAALERRHLPLPGQVPPWLAGAIERALSPRVEDRFPDCASFARALERPVARATEINPAGEGGHVDPVVRITVNSLPEPLPPPRPEFPWGAALAWGLLLGLALVAAVSIWALRGGAG